MRAEGEHDLNGVPILFPEPRLKLEDGRMALFIALLFKVVFIREKWEKPVDIFSSLVELIVFSGMGTVETFLCHDKNMLTLLERHVNIKCCC